jgi:L-aspartate oxidase
MVDTKIQSSSSNHMEKISADALIIGSGVAGLMSALTLSEKVEKVVVATLSLDEGASSTYAQGGIAIAAGDDDHVKHHAEDTIRVACGIGDEKIIRMVTEEGPELLQKLMNLGVNFDKCEKNNTIKFGKEAAHSKKRIAHAGGDQTGKKIMQALEKTVKQVPNITIYNNASGQELQLDRNGRVTGATILLDDGSFLQCNADAIVLASGGIGQLYSYTTNPVGVNGKGMVMAAMVGAELADMEFVQFHPTAFDFKQNPVPLATEAIRGEGAYLVTDEGDRFMPDIHPDAELAPRDIVSQAIWAQISKGRKVFLDSRHSTGERFPERFPTVYKYCTDNGINPITDLIPVSPVAHYQMGGVKVDSKGRTTVSGLWACGEASSTGLHGANRLASNSLLEALVYAKHVANDVEDNLKTKENWNKAENIDALCEVLNDFANKTLQNSENDENMIYELRECMYKNAGVVRNAKGLSDLISFADKILQNDNISKELFHRAILSKIIAVSALKREESRGSHYREDFKETLDKCAVNSKITIFDILK